MNMLAVDTSPLHPGGDPADRIQYIYTPIFWVSVFFWVGVSLLILFAALRFRRRYDDEEPVQTHGSNRLETAWTITPFLILIVLFAITAINMPFLKQEYTATTANTMQVHVDAFRYGWTYTYGYRPGQSGSDPSFTDGKGKPITITSAGAADYTQETADPLVIPTGTPVQLYLDATDVIHSYYVPTLGGQINAVPGQQNRLWIEANQPGPYFGQCTELCGQGHAHMFIVIDAVSPSDFQNWRDACLSAQASGGSCGASLFQKTFHRSPYQYPS